MEIKKNILGTPPCPTPIYTKLFDFIHVALPSFKPLSRQFDGVSIVESEDDITDDLVDFLDNLQEHSKEPLRFKFNNQNKRTDIGVRLGRTYKQENRALFCWIEAKRLPTPFDKNRDEREYVFVDDKRDSTGRKIYRGGGGIQRFKYKKHAPNLKYSAMIAYIQDCEMSYWISKINGWIDGLIYENPSDWSVADKLVPKIQNKDNYYISTHNRIDSKTTANEETIVLTHFWIKV